jgi:two-component system sensor histidine kinase RegB
MSGEAPEPVAPRNPGILYGLGNLVENATDFAKSKVRIVAMWDSERVVIIIEDDGPGFAPGVQLQLGEPYVTTRGGERRLKSEEGGLGLGLFIAKTLLERSAASVSMQNLEAPARGARVTVSWPRSQFERPRARGEEAEARPAA